LHPKQQLFIEGWLRFPGSSELRRSVTWADLENFETVDYVDKWLIFFFMSWDTDSARMPQTLYVTVDDTDGSVTQISHV